MLSSESTATVTWKIPEGTEDGTYMIWNYGDYKHLTGGTVPFTGHSSKLAGSVTLCVYQLGQSVCLSVSVALSVCESVCRSVSLSVSVCWPGSLSVYPAKLSETGLLHMPQSGNHTLATSGMRVNYHPDFCLQTQCMHGSSAHGALAAYINSCNQR